MRLLSLAPTLVLALALPFSLACRPTASSTESGTTYRITGVVTESACSPGLDPIDPIAFEAEVRSTGSIVYWRLGTSPWIPGTIAPDGTFRITTRVPLEVTPAYAGTDPDFDPPRPGCTLLQTETIAGRFSEPVVPDGGWPDGGASDAGTDATLADASSTDAAPSDAAPSDAAPSDAATDTDASVRDAGPPDPTAVGSLEATNTIELAIQPGSDCRAILAENGGAFPTLPCAVRYALFGAATD